jgi:peroxiredoxin
MPKRRYGKDTRKHQVPKKRVKSPSPPEDVSNQSFLIRNEKAIKITTLGIIGALLLVLIVPPVYLFFAELVHPSTPYGFNYSVTTIDETSKDISDYRGRCVILYLVDIDSTACDYQTNHLKDVYDAFTRTELEIVMLDVQGAYSWELAQYRTDFALSWLICKDKVVHGDCCQSCGGCSELEISSLFTFTVAPVVVILDKQGNINQQLEGEQIASVIEGYVQDVLDA